MALSIRPQMALSHSTWLARTPRRRPPSKPLPTPQTTHRPRLRLMFTADTAHSRHTTIHRSLAPPPITLPPTAPPTAPPTGLNPPIRPNFHRTSSSSSHTHQVARTNTHPPSTRARSRPPTRPPSSPLRSSPADDRSSPPCTRTRRTRPRASPSRRRCSSRSRPMRGKHRMAVNRRTAALHRQALRRLTGALRRSNNSHRMVLRPASISRRRVRISHRRATSSRRSRATGLPKCRARRRRRGGTLIPCSVGAESSRRRSPRIKRTSRRSSKGTSVVGTRTISIGEGTTLGRLYGAWRSRKGDLRTSFICREQALGGPSMLREQRIWVSTIL